MKIKIIHNPYSNRWNSDKRWPEVETLLKEKGVEVDVVHSDSPAGLYQLASQAATEGYEAIIGAGGDGTIGTIVNAVTHTVGTESLPIFGLLPMGTGNDLAFALDLPGDLPSAIDTIIKGKTKTIDLGQVNDIYFINNCGLGIEPYVTVIQNGITWIKGVIRYLVAAVKAIMDGPVWHVDMKWEGGEYSGPFTLLYAGNGPRTGGMFFMGANSKIDDGKLTFVYGFKPNRRSMFALLPRTLFQGEKNYVSDPAINEMELDGLSITFKEPSPMHTDGEVAPEYVTEANFKIHPGVVRFLVP